MEQRISTTTASRLLRVSKSTIQRQIKAGNLKAEMQKVSQGGGNCGMSNMIPVSEVLQQLDTQGRLLWYESQSGLSTQVSAAGSLRTYKEAFGEEGLTELANRQQAVMALDGILNSGERGRTAAIDELAKKIGVTSRTLRRWHAAYKTGGLAAIMDKVERKDKGKTRSMCQLAQDYVEEQMGTIANSPRRWCSSGCGSGHRSWATTPATAACTAMDRVPGGHSSLRSGMPTRSAKWQRGTWSSRQTGTRSTEWWRRSRTRSSLTHGGASGLGRLPTCRRPSA